MEVPVITQDSICETIKNTTSLDTLLQLRQVSSGFLALVNQCTEKILSGKSIPAEIVGQMKKVRVVVPIITVDDIGDLAIIAKNSTLVDATFDISNVNITGAIIRFFDNYKPGDGGTSPPLFLKFIIEGNGVCQGGICEPNDRWLEIKDNTLIFYDLGDNTPTKRIKTLVNFITSNRIPIDVYVGPLNEIAEIASSIPTLQEVKFYIDDNTSYEPINIILDLLEKKNITRYEFYHFPGCYSDNFYSIISYLYDELSDGYIEQQPHITRFAPIIPPEGEDGEMIFPNIKDYISLQEGGDISMYDTIEIVHLPGDYVGQEELDEILESFPEKRRGDIYFNEWILSDIPPK